MLRMTRIALMAGALLATSMSAAAQDQEEGDIDVDLPERKREVEPAPGESMMKRSAQGIGPLRVYGGFSLSVGGELKGEESDEGADLEVTPGLQGGVEYVLHDYFSIGGEMRFLFPEPEGWSGRSLLWDIVVKPKGRFAFPNLPLEVYGSLPLGLTVPGIDGEPEGTVGWNIGIVGGATLFFTDKMGIQAELGWHFHKFGIEIEGVGEGDAKMNQFLLLSPNFVYVL